MRILLSNDDGINAVGLRAIYKALIAAGHEVDVFAPACEQSAASSRISIHDPLRVHAVEDDDFRGTAVTGTPADCVMMGLHLHPTPDIVVTGINAGPNIGMDVLYSGTVASALEGALHGIPALALSHGRRKPAASGEDTLNDRKSGLADAAAHAATLVTSLPWAELTGRVVNVNYPAGSIAEALARGVRTCPLSPTPWKAAFAHRKDTRGADYWWFDVEGSRFNLPPEETDTDVALLLSGHITVTPLRHSPTDITAFPALQKALAIVS